MKRLFTFIVLLLSVSIVKAQSFSTTTTLPFDLDNGTGYSSCASPGTKSFDFNVTGVGTLSSSKALTQIKIEFDASCGGNLRNIAAYLKSPSGTCLKVYDGTTGGMGTSWTLSSVNMILTNPSACLSVPNPSNMPTDAVTSSASSSNYGFFAASNDMVAAFSGESANGTWTMYWFESAISAPCVKSLSIVFGDPIVADQIASGDNCSSPIVWNGGPVCAQTSGKTGSAQMPGSLNGAGTSGFGTISGATCGWNAANNNDVWIQFTPNSTSTCIGISGLQFNLQSIVVTDANADNDNDPCTGSLNGSDDPRWTVVSCPNNNVYTGTSGTQRNQNHCFTSVPGKKYYLVVDGNGGAESPFYISGIIGTFVDPGPLPVKLLSFRAKLSGGAVLLDWETESEINNSHFTIERSTNGRNWQPVKNVTGAGTSNIRHSYHETDLQPLSGISYYRLKQTNTDGKSSYSSIEVIRNGRSAFAQVSPNPVGNLVTIAAATGIRCIKVYNAQGACVTTEYPQARPYHEMDTRNWAKGAYWISIEYNNDKHETVSVIK